MHIIPARVLHVCEKACAYPECRRRLLSALAQRDIDMTTAEMEKATGEHSEDSHDEEKGLLDEESSQKQGVQAAKVLPTGLSGRFWFASAVNCLSTASIVGR